MEEQEKKENKAEEAKAGYDPKLKVNGSFMDIIKVVVKDAKKKAGKKN